MIIHINHMKKNFIICIFFSITSIAFKSQSQNLNQFYQSIVNVVSYDTLIKNLRIFQSFGVKTFNTQAIRNTKEWILRQYENYGYTDISIDSFNVFGYQHNIIVTKTGTLYPDSFLIICGHYDTKFGPGTNDNGSGTCAILETARLLQNLNTKYSIKFIHFTGEESGWLGSYHYILNVVVPQNIGIRLVFNIDCIGGIVNYSNDTLACENDQSDPLSNNALSLAYTDTLRNLTELYSSLNTKIDSAWGSDYIPFQEYGYTITGYYQYCWSPYFHTAEDTLGNLDLSYYFNVCKAATGSALYLSGAIDSAGTIGNFILRTDIYAYPNPASDFIKIYTGFLYSQMIFELYDISGRMVLSEDVSENEKVNIRGLNKGLYYFNLFIDDKYKSGKIVVE